MAAESPSTLGLWSSHLAPSTSSRGPVTRLLIDKVFFARTTMRGLKWSPRF